MFIFVLFKGLILRTVGIDLGIDIVFRFISVCGYLYFSDIGVLVSFGRFIFL